MRAEAGRFKRRLYILIYVAEEIKDIAPAAKAESSPTDVGRHLVADKEYKYSAYQRSQHGKRLCRNFKRPLHHGRHGSSSALADRIICRSRLACRLVRGAVTVRRTDAFGDIGRGICFNFPSLRSLCGRLVKPRAAHSCGLQICTAINAEITVGRRILAARGAGRHSVQPLAAFFTEPRAVGIICPAKSTIHICLPYKRHPTAQRQAPAI